MKDIIIKEQQDEALLSWRKTERKALQLLGIIGEMRFERGIELILFREEIYDLRPSELINVHSLSKNVTTEKVSVTDTYKIAQGIKEISSIPPSKLDIGRLAAEWIENGRPDVVQFITDRLDSSVITDDKPIDSKDVILYGFGRIGRLLARRLILSTGKGEQLRLRAIVIRPKMEDVGDELRKRASLLAQDSVHGDFKGTIEIDEENRFITVNGNKIFFIFAGHPSDIDYTEFGISDAIVIDNTGVWRDNEALKVHMRPGVKNVMLTAPGKGIPNIVYGINHSELTEDDNILCAASCTTNAISPILKVVDDEFKILKGHIETIHAYTSDQNLLDNFHKKPRRGRAAALNMVLTTTGAAKAVSKVIPHLEGKLTGNAVRVPTPDVSLAIMSLTFDKETSIEQLNGLIRKASLSGDLVEQIHVSDSPEYVSTNAIGMTSTSVLDALSTNISDDGKTATIYAWYDNEYGYCCQVVRLAKHVAQVRRPIYY